MDAWKNRLMDMQEALDVQREMLMHERNRAQLHECLRSWILPDPDAVDSRLASVTVSGFAPVLPWHCSVFVLLPRKLLSRKDV